MLLAHMQMTNEGSGPAADNAGRRLFQSCVDSQGLHTVQRCGVGEEGKLMASVHNLSLSQGLQGAGRTNGGMVPSGSVVAVRGRCWPRALEGAFDWTGATISTYQK